MKKYKLIKIICFVFLIAFTINITAYAVEAVAGAIEKLGRMYQNK